jgi:hypothetical protein
MKKLRSDWLTAHWEEEELPRYEFLDYLQGLHHEMSAGKLFPVWEDGYAVYAGMKQTQEALEKALGLTPYLLKEIDLTTLRVLRVPDAQTPGFSALEQARNRLAFARPLLKRAMQRSEQLRLEWMQEIALSPVGLRLPNPMEGVLLLKIRQSYEISGWLYRYGIQTDSKYAYTSIQLKPAGLYRYSLRNTLNAIRDHCKQQAGWEGLPVNTWLAEAQTPMPVFHTLKPLAVMKLSSELLN